MNLITLNDNFEYTFNQIADILDKFLDRYNFLSKLARRELHY